MFLIALIAWVVISIILTVKWWHKSRLNFIQKVIVLPVFLVLGIVHYTVENFRDNNPPFFNGIEN